MFANLPQTALTALAGAALFSLLPLTSAGPVQEDDAQPEALGLLPPATVAIDIPDGRDLSLADLVDALADSTGLRFVVSSATRQFLNDTPTGLLSGGAVQPEEAYTFVESVLRRHRVVLERLGGQQVPVAALYWLDGGRDVNGIGWSTVAAEDLDALSGHGALLVQTSIDVSPNDARQLANAARSLIRDVNFQNVVPLNASTVLLRGTASDVASIAEHFRIAGENEAAMLEANRAEAQEQGAENQSGDGH